MKHFFLRYVEGMSAVNAQGCAVTAALFILGCCTTNVVFKSCIRASEGEFILVDILTRCSHLHPHALPPTGFASVTTLLVFRARTVWEQGRQLWQSTQGLRSVCLCSQTDSCQRVESQHLRGCELVLCQRGRRLSMSYMRLRYMSKS